jgi:DNA-binding transcriptional ArsR family regulator
MSSGRSLPPTRIREAAPLFSALGDATRLGLLASLCANGPATVTLLAGTFQMTRQALTKHLAVLARAGLVKSERQGRERFWCASPRRLQAARELLARLG